MDSDDSEWFNEVSVSAIDQLKRTRSMSFKDLRTGRSDEKLYPVKVVGRSDTVSSFQHFIDFNIKILCFFY